MKASVDRDTCTGCGLCPQICPDVFDQDDEDLAFAKVEVVDPDDEDDCREAADSCPVEAITIQE